MLNVYVGWDSYQETAYEVCKYSLIRNSSQPIRVRPLKQSELRNKNLYYRDRDLRASTQFSITRFLVPVIAKHKGWAVFCDSDFLWLEDISKLFDLADNRYAVQVVKHDYTPRFKQKMHRVVQHNYPKKNWSSLVLWNCEHPSNSAVDVELVNEADPSYLHQFKWLKDHEIGEIHYDWNCLSGYYDLDNAKAIHYTDGGPWLLEYKNCEGAQLWRDEYERLCENSS